MADTSEGLGTGPLKVDGMSVFFRMIAGAVGGVAGTLVIFMGILLGGSIIGVFVGDATTPGAAEAEAAGLAANPLAVFFILTLLLFASLASTGLGSFLIGLTNTDKYVRLSRGLLQILLVNVVIFVMIIPVYFVVRSVNDTMILQVAALHFFFCSLTAAIVFEVIATDMQQVLLGIYSVIISVFSGFLMLIVVFLVGDANVTLFAIPIVLWFSIGFVGGAVEYFYYQIYKRSGVDVLSGAENPYQATVAQEEDQKAREGLQK